MGRYSHIVGNFRRYVMPSRISVEIKRIIKVIIKITGNVHAFLFMVTSYFLILPGNASAYAVASINMRRKIRM